MIDSGLHRALVKLLVRLRDPATIPALARSPWRDDVVDRTLADFGELAAPAVLEVVTAPESPATSSPAGW